MGCIDPTGPARSRLLKHERLNGGFCVRSGGVFLEGSGLCLVVFYDINDYFVFPVVWFLYIYINKEVTGGLVSWVVYVLQLFVVFRLVLLTKNLGGDRNGFLFTCAVVGLAFVIEFVVRKLTSCFSRQSPAEE